MDSNSTDDTNTQVKRKFEDSDSPNDGIKRSKACNKYVYPIIDSEEKQQYNLLYFSDDVILHILSFLHPRELKALSFCCRRLARLCMDRSLWRNVELREQAIGVRSLSFYMHFLHSSTNSLYIRGLIGAKAAKDDVPLTERYQQEQQDPSGCECVQPDYIESIKSRLAYRLDAYKKRSQIANRAAKENGTSTSNGSNQSDPKKENTTDRQTSSSSNSNGSVDTAVPNSSKSSPNSSNPSTSKESSTNTERGETCAHCNSSLPSTSYPFSKLHKETGNKSPKPFSAAYEDYPQILQTSTENEDSEKDDKKEEEKKETAECCKYRTMCLASLNKDILVQIKQRCLYLSDLRLEYCNLDCNPFSIPDLPNTLKILSLKGCRKTNLPFQRACLFKVQDHLTQLEELDLSYCYWLTGHSLLLLSKMQSLRKLLLRGCTGLGECVAYASLSTRFGFKSLEILDMRGTSVGDSEVSSFGSLVTLRELYLEPPQSNEESTSLPHNWPVHSGLMENWEIEDPHSEVEEYIKVMKEEMPVKNVSGCGDKDDKSDKPASKNRANDTQRNGNDADEHRDNFGLYYRSVLNLSYEGPQNVQDDNQRNNENQEQEQPPQRDRPQQHENLQENAVGVQVGPLGVQVGPLGVHVGPVGVQVGPVRFQMRSGARVEREQAEPRNEQPGMPDGGGVEVGPVQVQVGPEGVLVGCGVRVGPEWVQNNPDGRFQVELGRVRVDPGWNIRPENVHVGFEAEVVRPHGAQAAPERPQENNLEGPVEVQVGPIEVQVGGMRFDDEIFENAERIVERHIIPRQNVAANNHHYELNNGNRAEPGAARAGDGDDRNPQDMRDHIEIEPVGYEFHVRHINPNAERNNRNEQDVARRDEADGEREGNQDGGRRQPEANGRQYNVIRFGHERIHVHYRDARQPDNADNNPHFVEVRRSLNQILEGIQHRMGHNNRPRLFRHDRENGNERDNGNDNNERNNANERNPPNPPANDIPVPNRLQNIMDGRVHVIYVDPRLQRRMPAEVFVAGGRPRRGAIMMVEEANFWPVRDMHGDNVFEMPFIQLPIWNNRPRRIDGAELVTDTSILRLGDSEQLIHVGARQPRRRRTCHLEVLVCRGYRGVTDRSLVHLASAAPMLRHLDIEDCGITSQGVAAFTNVRPECAVYFKPYDPPEE